MKDQDINNVAMGIMEGRVQEDYNKDGRAQVEAGIKFAVKGVQNALDAFGQVIEEYGDEFMTPSYLQQLSDALRSVAVSYVEKVTRVQGGGIKTTDQERVYYPFDKRGGR